MTSFTGKFKICRALFLRLGLRRTDTQRRENIIARIGVGDDLGQQVGPAHATAPHRFIERIGQRGMRLCAAKEIGDLAQRAQRFLARRTGCRPGRDAREATAGGNCSGFAAFRARSG